MRTPLGFLPSRLFGHLPPCSPSAALMLSMLDAGHDLPLCRAVAGQLIGDHHTGRPHLPLQQLAQQPLGRLLVAAALHQNVEHHAGLVHGSPKPMLCPSNFEHDLVEMPFVARSRKAAADLVGKLLAELERPLPHRFVATMIPRAASNSSTIRSPSGKRKYSRTAWPMISAGNRYPV